MTDKYYSFYDHLCTPHNRNLKHTLDQVTSELGRAGAAWTDYAISIGADPDELEDIANNTKCAFSVAAAARARSFKY